VIDAHYAARALGGDVAGHDSVLCPGPGHSPRDRSLSVRFLPDGGFICFSHSPRDDWRDCREHVGALLGIDSRASRLAAGTRSRPKGKPVQRPSEIAPGGAISQGQALNRASVSDDAQERTRAALALWRESLSLPSTLGHRYLTEHRRLPIERLGDLSHVLRWHEGRRCVVALMTDPSTAKPTGIHRTFLAPDGSKIERKMLGKQGVVRRCTDDAVTMGLGLAEGIEDGLAIMLSGWTPIWSATTAGAIKRLPVLSGIEALTIFADADSAGMKAANNCARRWREVGREVAILPPIRLEAAA
jgi:putative DNA primase/helicase